MLRRSERSFFSLSLRPGSVVYAKVPAEIIKELAPGLEFNAEGAPIMPNVGEGMMPNLPGFPMGGGADGQNCCVS